MYEIRVTDLFSLQLGGNLNSSRQKSSKMLDLNVYIAFFHDFWEFKFSPSCNEKRPITLISGMKYSIPVLVLPGVSGEYILTGKS